MSKKDPKVMSDKEFLEVLGKAFYENKDILTLGNTNEGLQDAIEDVREYHQTIYDNQNQGKVTLDSQCQSNA